MGKDRAGKSRVCDPVKDNGDVVTPCRVCCYGNFEYIETRVSATGASVKRYRCKGCGSHVELVYGGMR